MIELDEKDVRSIASGRFSRRSIKWFLPSTLGLLISLFILLGLSKPFSDFVIVPAVCLLVVTVVFERGLDKERKDLVKEWKEEKE